MLWKMDIWVNQCGVKFFDFHPFFSWTVLISVFYKYSLLHMVDGYSNGIFNYFALFLLFERLLLFLGLRKKLLYKFNKHQSLFKVHKFRVFNFLGTYRTNVDSFSIKKANFLLPWLIEHPKIRKLEMVTKFTTNWISQLKALKILIKIGSFLLLKSENVIYIFHLFNWLALKPIFA